MLKTGSSNALIVQLFFQFFKSWNATWGGKFKAKCLENYHAPVINTIMIIIIIYILLIIIINIIIPKCVW